MSKKKSKKAKTKKVAKQVSPDVPVDPGPEDNSPALLSTLYSVNQMKICRLCESRSGPFLNIFGDAELELSKKIDDLLPFEIKEDDDLPHKVCFRCTAKIEELYLFVQKSIESQENLQRILGKENNYVVKAKPVKRKWNDCLSKMDTTKSDLCDSIIQKAIERMKVLQPDLKVAKDTDIQKKLNHITIKRVVQPENVEEDKEEDQAQFTTRSMARRQSPKGKPPPKKVKANIEVENIKTENQEFIENTTTIVKSKLTNSTKTTEFRVEPTPNTFDIMQHVTIIKVNGVGTLFQCKLCDRNFLSRDSVLSHGCAKSGGLKVQSLAKSFNTDQTNTTENKVAPSKPKPGPARFKQSNSDNQCVITKVTSSQNNSSVTSCKILKLNSNSNNTYTINNKNISDSVIIRKVVKDQNVTSNGKDQSSSNTEVSNQSQPYPVGLFRTPPLANDTYLTPNTHLTPAMKKQSYQVLQTDNPSKLLISSKASAPGPKSAKQKIANEKQVFAFVNLDAHEQPSYVLPTDNITQETRAAASEVCSSTSQLYTCNLCSLSFSREKKLLAHIQDHFNKMDAEIDKDASRSKGKVYY